MATRIAARYISRRLSSGGKVLGEEEKAAENIYIKKIEKEKLEKLAHKGQKPDEALPTSPAGSAPIPEATPSGQASSTAKVSIDKYKTYAIAAGIATIAATAGWYLRSSNAKTEKARD